MAKQGAKDSEPLVMPLKGCNIASLRVKVHLAFNGNMQIDSCVQHKGRYVIPEHGMWVASEENIRVPAVRHLLPGSVDISTGMNPVRHVICHTNTLYSTAQQVLCGNFVYVAFYIFYKMMAYCAKISVRTLAIVRVYPHLVVHVEKVLLTAKVPE